MGNFQTKESVDSFVGPEVGIVGEGMLVNIFAKEKRAVIIMDDTTCMVDTLYRLSEFYMEESCGQCTPCREGTGWLVRLLHRIKSGHGEASDIDKLVNVANKIEGRTICALGEAAAWPVQSFVKHFRNEFEYYVKHKQSIVTLKQ